MKALRLAFLKSFWPSVYHSKMWESRQVPFPTVQHVNLPACSPHCPFNAERQVGKLGIPILKLLVWPDSESNSSLHFTAAEADALTTRPSELLNLSCNSSDLTSFVFRLTHLLGINGHQINNPDLQYSMFSFLWWRSCILMALPVNKVLQTVYIALSQCLIRVHEPWGKYFKLFIVPKIWLV